MKKTKLLHTPDGVRDIYNSELEGKILLEEKLMHTLESFGYHQIQTPSIEFFDIFGKEVGTISRKDLYKFFDREGNTLVLRPDITPSVARAAAKYFMDETVPLRLCYKGNTFQNNHSYRGRLHETTQLGAELIGDSSLEADGELIAMAVECLKESGLSEFQIGIGHAGFLRGLFEEAGFDEDTEWELRGMLENKNFFGMQELVSESQLSSDLEALFGLIGKFYTNVADMKEVKDLAKNYPGIIKTIEHLEKLEEVLKLYGVNDYVSYDLGMTSSYQYYTGIIFNGYTYGSGEPVVKGGRYDQLLNYFGKQAPAIGFAFVVDQLLAALMRQGRLPKAEKKRALIVYTKDTFDVAVTLAKENRNNGILAELCDGGRYNAKDLEDYIARNQFDQIYRL